MLGTLASLLSRWLPAAEPRRHVSAEDLLDLLRQPPAVVALQDYPWVDYSALPAEQQDKHTLKRYRTSGRRAYLQGCGRYFDLTYRSLDGQAVRGVLALPRPFDPGRRYPTVIWNHGGFDRGTFTSLDVVRIDRIYTSLGCAVFLPQYRPIDWSNYADFGVKDVDDSLAMLALARAYPFVDEDRIYLHGESRGGMVTYLALARGAAVRAAVVCCGLTGWPAFTADLLEAGEAVTGLSEREIEAFMRARSVLAWPEKIDVPLLMLQGGNDVKTPLEGARKLAAALESLGREHRLVVYPNARHCLKGARGYHLEIHDWLRKHGA